MNERCDHVNGCVTLLPSIETVKTDDHGEDTSFSALEPTAERYCKIGTYWSEVETTTAIKSGTGTYWSEVETTTAIKSGTGYSNIQSSVGTICALLMFLLLVFVSLACFCWKYNITCKRRGQTNITHHDVSSSFSLQGDTHEYMEIDDGFLNVESQKNDAQSTRSSASLTGGSGICGVDNDGYLNPYQELKSIEITLSQEQSSEQSSTETSFIHAQENIVNIEDQDE
ncbi:unnamed protein product [Mytilus coruscus]|uniref:Uncharacterized protein n=1 Tax=Mytilus coruscus TaxID=42192 RepID=A0A6J8D2J0_MYTCO|nr:unnamed protein product [Mytilus coruscus]